MKFSMTEQEKGNL